MLIFSFAFHLFIQSLEQSCKYYAEQGIPFPKAILSEEDKKSLKECYLFDDAENPEAPILLFFPQVNDTFRYFKAPGMLSTIVVVIVLVVAPLQ